MLYQRRVMQVLVVLISFFAIGMGLMIPDVRAETTLLNVSYDPTRGFYEEYNKAFADYWAKETGEKIIIRASHGGSGKQSRSVIDGLRADVVSLALSYDIDRIAQSGLLSPDWQSRLPNRSSPYTSTIVLVVRKGNPRNIRDWGDLIQPGMAIVTPNPKTSGGARWNYLAAWGWALKQHHHDEDKARAFVRDLYRHVPVLDAGARGSMITFLRNGIGDVLIAWENEALLAIDELGGQKGEVIYPSRSILAEPPVAIVDQNVDKKGTRRQAEAYLRYLYSPEGQSLASKYHFRPSDPQFLKTADFHFPEIDLFTIDEVFGGWKNAQSVHFSDGGTFDQIYQPEGDQ